LLPGKIDVENPDTNYRFSNIESTATCKRHMEDMTGFTVEWTVGKLKWVTFIVKFGCQGSINVMCEVEVKVGSRVRRISCIFDYEFHWIY